MRGAYTAKVSLNRFLRFFKFGYIPGRSIISLRAHIERGMRFTIGKNSSIGDYSRLTGRGSGTIAIGDNTDIGHFVLLEARRGGFIKIGNGSGINAFSVVYGHGGVTIGDHTRIACNAIIMAGNHNFDDPTKNIYEQGVSKKGIVIGNDVWVGGGVHILDGVTIIFHHRSHVPARVAIWCNE